MRDLIAGITAIVTCLSTTTALAQPAHPPPTEEPPVEPPAPTPTDPTAPATSPAEPAPAPPVVKPPYVTVSNMPVSHEVPDTSADAEPYHRALISTGVTAGFVAATAFWYLYENRFEYIDKTCTPNVVNGTDLNDCQGFVAAKEAYFLHRQKVWSEVMWPLGVATLTSAFITAYLWSRHHKPPRTVIGITPSQTSGTVSLMGSF